MTSFDIIAIPTEIADAVRSTMKAPGYGHPAHTETATGHGPCRHCLRTFEIGVDRRILFTYDPFSEVGCPALPGPIFVHADPCERFDEKAGYPEQLRTHSVILQAFGCGRRMVSEECVDDGQIERVIERLFRDEDVKYVLVRDTEAGCYDPRIERPGRMPAANPSAECLSC